MTDKETRMLDVQKLIERLIHVQDWSPVVVAHLDSYCVNAKLEGEAKLEHLKKIAETQNLCDIRGESGLDSVLAAGFGFNSKSEFDSFMSGSEKTTKTPRPC